MEASEIVVGKMVWWSKGEIEAMVVKFEKGWVEISAGVERNDRVVTRGGFDIHLASLMGTVESHRH